MSGLKVLEENVYGNVSVEKRIETILDTRSACKIAVDTLSEMLTFDKITQGLMSLEMTTFEVYSFITECLGPFRLQVYPLMQQLGNCHLHVSFVFMVVVVYMYV